MSQNKEIANRRAQALVELLDIPDSYYDLAADRYRSLGEWLHRPESSVKDCAPAVYPQGSFRYGTVIRPLFKNDEYDLDLVSELQTLSKAYKSQRDLKHLLGDEVKAYADAKNFNKPPEEKNRCWRLDYADKVNFHMDILPAIPEDESFKQALQRSGVDPALAALAISITDKRHPMYAVIDRDWPRSNPRGFGKWFENRMRHQAELRFKAQLAQRVFASIDDVPTWEWKTPLQRAIQILKRHRDVMFKDNCEVAPISMIITTMSAQAYQGEVDMYDALVGILDRMPDFVRGTSPRIPNPVNPGEDFADRWKTNGRLEDNFWKWHAQAKADVVTLSNSLGATRIKEYAEKKLRLSLNDESAGNLADESQAASKVRSSTGPAIIIASAPKPWGRH